MRRVLAWGSVLVAVALGGCLEGRESFDEVDPPELAQAAALEGAELASREDGELVVRVGERFSARRLREKSEILDDIASRLFGRKTRVSIHEVAADAGARGNGADPEAVRQRRADALNDPGVARALEILEGDVVEIRPLGDGQ